MKYVFFGTPEFAAIILEKLINAGFIPEAVICNPDKPVGRKKIITPPPVKAKIMNYESRIKNKIQILQPENLSVIHNSLFMLRPDFFIVAAYSKILPKEILEIPRLGTIGVHPSLLPEYRGPSPIQTAILNGDEITGVTLYLMDEKIDNGPILAQKALENYESGIMNYESLMRKLAELGADLLIEFLRKINQYCDVQPPRELTSIFGRLNLEEQDESQATYTKKFKTKDAYIEPKDLEIAQNQGGELAVQIDRKIRALNPEPGTWTYTKNSYENTKIYESTKTRRMKILEAVLTPDGKLKLKKIQFEGKKPVEI